MNKRGTFFIFVIGIFIILSFHFVSSLQTNSSNYESDLIISSGGNNASSSNYQTDIALGIISGNSSSSSFRQTTGFFSCVSKSCSSLGYNCDNWGDGCEGTLNCGTCSSGYTCTSGVCVAVPITPGGGITGGGAGGGAQEPFSVDKTLIKTLIKQGESARETIEIKNNLDSAINFKIESSLKQFMVISEESFSLTGKSSKNIFIDIFAKENEISDAYTGKITITGNNVTKIINLILEVKERKPLFDVIVDVLTKEVSIGDDVKARLKISNLGDLKNIDVFLYYAIKDFDGKTISFKEESIKIENELDIVRKLKIPENIILGDYVFYLKASYLNITASSTETFEVVETKPVSLSLILLIFGIVLIVIILIFVIILFRKLHHHLRGRREVRIERRQIKIIKEERKSIFGFFRKIRRRMKQRAIERIELREKRKRLRMQRKMRKILMRKLEDQRRRRNTLFKERQKRLLEQRIVRRKAIEERRIIEERKKQERLKRQQTRRTSLIEYLKGLRRKWKKKAEERKEERQREARLKHQREMRMMFFKERQERLQRMRETRMIALEEKQRRLRRLRITRRKTYKERPRKLIEQRLMREAEKRRRKLKRNLERTKKKEQKKKQRRLKIEKIKQKFLSRKIKKFKKRVGRKQKRKIKKNKHEEKKKTKKIKQVNKKERKYHHIRERINKAFFSKRFGNVDVSNLRNEIRDKGVSELELHKRTRKKR
jgi:hypothetical protein